MKLVQFLFRVLCFTVAVFLFGNLLNKAIVEIENFETSTIEQSYSDIGDSDPENPEEEGPVFSFFDDNLFIYQDFYIASLLNKINIHSPSRKLVSQTQSVPYSPPELEV